MIITISYLNDFHQIKKLVVAFFSLSFLSFLLLGCLNWFIYFYSYGELVQLFVKRPLHVSRPNLSPETTPQWLQALQPSERKKQYLKKLEMKIL